MFLILFFSISFFQMPSICHSLLENTFEEVIQKIQELDADDRVLPNDIFEIHFDQFLTKDMLRTSSHMYKKIRKMTHRPLLAVCKSETEKGRWEEQAHQSRVVELEKAVCEGFDIIDIGIHTPKKMFKILQERVAKEGKRHIGSYHNFSKFPDDLNEILLAFKNLRTDIIKISVTPQTEKQAEELIHLSKKLFVENIPAIVVGMGRIGRETRIQTPLYSLFPVMFAPLKADKRSKELGQVSVTELRKIWKK